ncbi:restriction endonuclease [Bradyrhizobium sp. WYCCWR 12699]|uniref:restriction endonuclease n=1 Tax=Bradyrhizobium sp. WYCCWR 12699 TaxID=3064203 RepID=UPI0028A30324|nr:restriction endonuclease [Bradyrhizobium sp. WYCCWR 12699]MDT4737248.1 restriction endonuclease [Bradyrhizobium sp. WYCCWR 12699]
MAIWTYTTSRSGSLNRDFYRADKCPYCRTDITTLEELGDVHSGKDGFDSDFRGVACGVCGWWLIKLYRINNNPPADQEDGSGPDFVHGWSWTHATLREFDVADISTPIEDVQDYLLAKYDKRFDVAPRLMEETVGSIFRNMGWDVVVTCYSNDGGIDAILTKGTETVAVQVKRYKNTIGVEQIREFTGALVAEGITSGIFATTSTFSKGVRDHVEKVSKRMIQIELLDAPRLYDALKIGRREKLKSIKEIFEMMEFQTIFDSDGVNRELLNRYFVSEGEFSVIDLQPWKRFI